MTRDVGPGGVRLPADVRLVASDLDGTLLLADGTVGPRTRAALDSLRAAGIGLVLVTGRPPRWLTHVAREAGHEGTAIAANGAVVADLSSERVTHVEPLPAAVALEVVDRLRSVAPGMAFAVERARVGGPLDEVGFGLADGYEPRWPVPDGTVRGPVEELVRLGGVVKLLARPPERLGLGADEVLTAAEAVLGGLVEATHSGARGTLLEMSPAGVDKGTALASLAAGRGLGAADVVAVGDMPNDLPMLRWAGAAYAVANAHPDVLDAVDGVLAHHDDEGVAALLEALAASTS